MFSLMFSPLALALLLGPFDPLRCDLSGYAAATGLTAAVAEDVLTLTWAGSGDEQVRLGVEVRSGVPTFQEVAVKRGAGAWSVVARDLTPEYRVVSGMRRISS